MNLVSQKGISILLTIISVALGLTIILGLANIFLNELHISESARNSVAAFYAADAGIERALFTERRDGGLSICDLTPCDSATLNNNATYEYYVTDNAGIRKVKAIGSLGETNRALEISYPAP